MPEKYWYNWGTNQLKGESLNIAQKFLITLFD